ncbi:MAG TPA: phytanoyl-CoA dioxygenase family protein [Caulobacteraceae bacterium]|jgi:ectoine hydroxylase-related dioxygenase (phytanoyl-CoA dioxygenase family)|nr:phytanoyl-CoA dioxygenase family protein [Caulobacteraceae bacterium]
MASAAPAPLATRRERTDARAWPDVPFVEGPDLEAHLDRIGADAETRAFARQLAETGLGRIDLGEEGRRLCEAVIADVEPLFADPKVVRVQDYWLRSKAVRKLALLPKVVQLLSRTYGRPAFPFQTLNFQRGSQQDFHSDAIHFHAEPARFMCGVWIALEDIEPDAGPLMYIPGSHKLPILTMRGAGVERDRSDHQDYADSYVPALASQLEASGLPRAEAVIRKGEALVWAANLAHGGAPISNPLSTRRSLVVHFYFEDCVYYTTLFSNPEDGRLAVRLPADVRTGGWRWPSRRGRPVKPNLGAFLGACAKLVFRRPIVTRTP